jgi:hypothetical protein
MNDYETRLDMVVTAAWETWTKNGLNMDYDMRAQTAKTVRDAAANAYVEDYTAVEWRDATLARLR